MREAVERHQAWIYLAAILAGMAVGRVAPAAATSGEVVLWPLLGVLLYAIFTQVPLVHLGASFRDGRFLAALLLGNFVVMPLFTGLLLQLVPDIAPIRLGVLLVLLVPCTDWFISFTHLGRGDAVRAIAAAPLLLLAQLLLLPLYIWLYMGPSAIEIALGGHLLAAFGGLIVVPLILAGLTEWAAGRHPPLARFIMVLGWLPIPLLATVVFIIAASQVGVVVATSSVLWTVVAVFMLYLAAAAAAAKALGHAFRMNPTAGRTLVFSFGTRNSFVVLPLALALPDPWRQAVVVIVLQSLVELFGMVVYLKWVPGRLFRDATVTQRTPP